MSNRKRVKSQYGLVVTIREYWKQHAKRLNKYEPRIGVDETTNEIKSDMVNGYPPALPLAKGRGR